jgi:hypothetical protein
MNAAHIHSTLSSCCATLQQMLRRNMCLSITPQRTSIRTTTCTAPTNRNMCMYKQLPAFDAAATRMLSLLACICRQHHGSSASTTGSVPPCCPCGHLPAVRETHQQAVQLFHNETLSWDAPAPAERDQQSSAFLSVCLSCHQVAHGNT